MPPARTNHLMAGQQFSPAELNAMEAAFGKANLSGWTIDGGRIRIPSGQRGAFMGALADSPALPSEFGSHLRKALDQGGLFVSRKEREERLKIATQEELADILRNMKGIEKASVIYDVAKKARTLRYGWSPPRRSASSPSAGSRSTPTRCGTSATSSRPPRPSSSRTTFPSPT